MDTRSSAAARPDVVFTGQVPERYWPPSGPDTMALLCGRCGMRLHLLTRPFPGRDDARSLPHAMGVCVEWVDVPRGTDASRVITMAEPQIQVGTMLAVCGRKRCRARHRINTDELGARVARAIAAGARRVIWGEGPYERSHG